jgi:hypothetical protein
MFNINFVRGEYSITQLAIGKKVKNADSVYRIASVKQKFSRLPLAPT